MVDVRDKIEVGVPGIQFALSRSLHRPHNKQYFHNSITRPDPLLSPPRNSAKVRRTLRQNQRLFS